MDNIKDIFLVIAFFLNPASVWLLNYSAVILCC